MESQDSTPLAEAAAAPSAPPTPEGVVAQLLSFWQSIRSIVILALCAFAFMLFNLYRNQNSILYHPTIPQIPFKRIDETPAPFASPADEQWGMAFEELYLTSLDGTRIHAWHIPAPPEVDSSSAPTVVYFHANALHMGFRLGLARAMHRELRCNVLLSSYRGYGNSEGSPSERGIELDADAVLAWVTANPQVDKRKIFLYGQSLGGAVAIQQASVGNYAGQVAGLIVENTFTSISDMVDHLMPWLKIFKRLVLKLKWSSISVVHRVTSPMLFISGLRDELVPPSHMLQLHDAATNCEDKEIYTVADGGHNDTQQKAGEEYWLRILAFIERTLRRRLGGADAGSRPSSEEQRDSYAVQLSKGREQESIRQAALRMQGKATHFPGYIVSSLSGDAPPSGTPVPSMGGGRSGLGCMMPDTAGPGVPLPPAVPLDLPPGGQAVADLTGVHLSGDGSSELGEGAAELVSEALREAAEIVKKERALEVEAQGGRRKGEEGVRHRKGDHAEEL